MMRLLAAIACSVLFGPPDRAPVQPAVERHEADTTDSRLDAELREIDGRAAGVRDLTADFEQSRSSVLLKKPLISRGTVAVKGGRTLWRTTSPRASTMSIDGQSLRIYYPDQRVVEIFDLTDSLKQVAATPLPRLDSVRRQFAISPATRSSTDSESRLTIRLTPRDAELREKVESVLVTIDRTTAVASAITITDAEGEATSITFSNVRINTGLDDERLELKVPEGTRTSRPLESVRSLPRDRDKQSGPADAQNPRAPK